MISCVSVSPDLTVLCVIDRKLDGLGITSLSKGMFAKLTALVDLDLRDNGLSFLPQDAFYYNTNLRKL